MKSDVTALVLTIGEKTFNKSIESLKKQFLRPKDIIVVKNMVLRWFLWKPGFGVSQIRL